MRFTVRVELFDTNDGTDDEYETLHTEMENAGFSRTIISDSGIEYHLPPAEYNLIGDYEADEVRTVASKAASKTGHTFCVLVTPSVGRFWSGLKEVKKHAHS